MESLTQQTLTLPDFPVTDWEIHSFNETVSSERIKHPSRLIRRYRQDGARVIVGLVGVQTNQFVRAHDLARHFLAAGAQVVIGGFHVSGSISSMTWGISTDDTKRKGVPCPGVVPPEILELISEGVTVFHGEAETVWRQTLTDLIADNPATRPTMAEIENLIKGRQTIPGVFYIGGRPTLTDAPLAAYPVNRGRYAATMGTIDTGRGCPFACSFCTIINVQGRDPRWRDPQLIIQMVKKVCQQRGSFWAFFTDDNLARNPHMHELLEGLADLRRQGHRVSFMAQADLASFHNIPGFGEALAQAGCRQVFLGMETVNPESLKQARKRQNRPEDYAWLCEYLHRLDIMVHVGYIVGFPNDTPQSVIEDVKTIRALGVDMASFYILTPLPGSEDHVRLINAGVAIDADFDRYDSFHAVTDHPLMTRAQLEATHRQAFKEFYRPRYMINSLRLTSPERFRGLFGGYLWYRNSILGERIHPMMCGFWSMRRRNERRPDWSRENLVKFWSQELWHRLRYLGLTVANFFIFQHVYFESRLSEEIARFTEDNRSALGRWLKKKTQLPIEKLQLEKELALKAMSRELTGISDWVIRTFALPPTRAWLNAFWVKYGRQKWGLLWKPYWHLKMVPYAVTEVIFALRFGLTLAHHFSYR